LWMIPTTKPHTPREIQWILFLIPLQVPPVSAPREPVIVQVETINANKIWIHLGSRGCKEIATIIEDAITTDVATITTDVEEATEEDHHAINKATLMLHQYQRCKCHIDRK
jgi:hypothetical protein